jgi:hypothetical protein
MKVKFQEVEHADLSYLFQELPPYVLRTHPRFKELTGYSGRTMANMDSLKQTVGVKKIMLGNPIAYERESLIRFCESRSRVIVEEVAA